MFFAGIVAFFWGVLWAFFLQFVPIGQFLVRKRTWITVVVGIGGGLFVLSFVIPWECWKRVAVVIALSSVGIITRSLANEWGEWRRLCGHKD